MSAATWHSFCEVERLRSDVFSGEELSRQFYVHRVWQASFQKIEFHVRVSWIRMRAFRQFEGEELVGCCEISRQQRRH